MLTLHPERAESPEPASQCMVGSSAAMRAAMAKMERVAPTALTVLLRGESGTGKGLFARAIHDRSPRRTAPFVAVNSAALPENLLESELFGHEKGAFTGAAALRKGRFELANGGTLFLDEIGEISPAFQAKLLRVLQEREFERVGGSRTIRVDVRIIAATNCDLEAAVGQGRFRSDLYFRLSIVPIRLPPLRERSGDIPLLAERLLQQYNAENGTGLAWSPDAVRVLCGCSFPGNVRELENCVRRTAILAKGLVIGAADFACRNEGCATGLMCLAAQAGASATPMLEKRSKAIGGGEGRPTEQRPGAARPPGRPRIADPDRLIEAMQRAGWSQARAGRLLGLTSRQVRYALKRHGIEVQKL
jgi:Nif-specific regulatory protein